MPAANDTYSIASGADLWAGRDGPLPSWVPAAGEVATLTVANGGLANGFGSAVPSHLAQFWSATVVNDYSGSVVNEHFGTHGAVLFNGAGHASGGNDNSVYALVMAEACEWRRLTTQVNLFPLDGIPNQGANIHAISTDLGEWSAAPDPSSQPADRHSYGDFSIVGPADGGAAYGTLYSVQPSSLGQQGALLAQHAAHKVEISSMTSAASAWARAGTIDPVSYGARGVVYSEYVSAQGRIYCECNGAAHNPRWFDLSTGNYVVGTGTGLSRANTMADGGTMFHVPSRNLMIYASRNGSGTLALYTMDVSVSQPSWNNTARTLSASIPIGTNWSTACWCPDSNRIIVGAVSGDADCVYEIEIPATLTDSWTCTRAGFPVGQTITWPTGSGRTYKKWSYNSKVRSIVFYPNAPTSGTGDTVWVYRPRNT